MGYSMSVVCRSERHRDEMLSFIKENFRHIWQILETKERPQRYSDFSSELDYSHRKFQIGYDYSCLDGLDTWHLQTVLRWMATKVGRKKIFKKIAEYGPIPYILYDGFEPWPIILSPEYPKESAWCACDELGILRDTIQVVTQTGFNFKYPTLSVLEEQSKGLAMDGTHIYPIIYAENKEAIDDTIKKQREWMERLDAKWKSRK